MFTLTDVVHCCFSAAISVFVCAIVCALLLVVEHGAASVHFQLYEQHSSCFYRCVVLLLDL